MSIADITLKTTEDCRAAWLYCHAFEDALRNGAPLGPDEQREILAIAQAALLIAASHRAGQSAPVAEVPLGPVPEWLKLLQETDHAESS